MTIETEGIAFKGIGWAAVTVMGEAEALAPARDMRNTMLLIGGTLLAIVAGVGLAFSRSITQPIARLI